MPNPVMSSTMGLHSSASLSRSQSAEIDATLLVMKGVIKEVIKTVGTKGIQTLSHFITTSCFRSSFCVHEAKLQPVKIKYHRDGSVCNYLDSNTVL